MKVLLNGNEYSLRWGRWFIAKLFSHFVKHLKSCLYLWQNTLAILRSVFSSNMTYVLSLTSIFFGFFFNFIWHESFHWNGGFRGKPLISIYNQKPLIHEDYTKTNHIMVSWTRKNLTINDCALGCCLLHLIRFTCELLWFTLNTTS